MPSDRIFRELSHAEYEHYLQKDYKHNYRVNILDVGTYTLGLSIVSLEVVLPAFVKKLGASDMLLSFLSIILILGNSVPQVFSSYFISRFKSVKPFLLTTGFLQRIPWLLTGILIICIGGSQPLLVLVLFIGLYCFSTFIGGVASPAWGELIAKSIPARIRGNFNGMIILTCSFFSLFGAFLVKFIMEEERFLWPLNYGILFLIAGILLFISYYFFALNREPVLSLQPSHHSHNISRFIRSIIRVFKKDTEFRKFILVKILFNAKTIGNAFLMVYAMQKLEINDTATGNFVLIITCGSLISSLLLGYFADKIGHKPCLILSGSMHTLSIILALVSHQLLFFYLSFFFLAVDKSGFAISERNIVYEFAPANKRPLYLGLIGSLTAPFLVLYSLIGGITAEHWGYTVPLWISLILVGMGIIIMILIRDPGKI